MDVNTANAWVAAIASQTAQSGFSVVHGIAVAVVAKEPQLNQKDGGPQHRSERRDHGYLACGEATMPVVGAKTVDQERNGASKKKPKNAPAMASIKC